MDNNLIIIGNESSVLYYNLNSHFTTQKKIIITKEIIIDSYQNGELRNFINLLKTTKKESFIQVMKDSEEQDVFNSQIDENLYKEITEKIPKISFSSINVELKDYNFMNSVSNTKFTITLRSENNSINKYFVEKGAILSSIRELVKSYVKSSHNLYRMQRIEIFQIEITESVDILKKIYLKKDGNSILLASSYGFPKNSPLDFLCGPEIYFSQGEDFKLFKNSQETLLIREHTTIVEKEMKKQEKILSNENLIAINKLTKNINDAIIEITIDKKEKIIINNVSLVETSLENANENGIILNSSPNNYSKISLLSLRDETNEMNSYPKYLLIRNETDILDLLKNLTVLEKFEGIIINYNFYLPILNWICNLLKIDLILYLKTSLKKENEISLDKVNIIIGSSQKNSTLNPFSHIINRNIEKTNTDSFSQEHLNNEIRNLNSNPQTIRNINSTPNNQKTQERDFIKDMAEGLISSPQSTTSEKASGIGWGPTPSMSSLSSKSKKSAIGMLAEAVINNDNKPLQETQQKKPYEDFSKSELLMNDVKPEEINPIKQHSFSVEEGAKTYEENNYTTTPIKTIILTNPSVLSGHYFVDSQTINDVGSGEIFFQTSNLEQTTNDSLNYVIPISIQSPNKPNIYKLITTPNEFFHVNKNSQSQYFINLTYVDDSIKKNFIETCSAMLDSFSIIAQKKDLSLLSAHLNKIKNLYIKNLEEIRELDLIKQQFGL